MPTGLVAGIRSRNVGVAMAERVEQRLHAADGVDLRAGLLTALSISHEAAVLLDPDLRIVWCNDAARAMGRLDDDDLGSSWGDHLPDGAEHELVHVQSMAVGSAPHSFASSRIDSYGMRVAVQVTVAPIEDDEGRLAGVAVVAADRSEQALLQEAMAEMAQRTEETQSLASVGLWVWDEESDNVQWTAELYRIHGIEPRDFDSSLEAHLAPVAASDRAQVRHALTQVVEKGDEVELTYPIDTPSGQRWIRSSVRPALDRGKVTGLVGTCQDITQQQAYAEAIERANRELERFAGAVAHDLKTPLTVVVGMADLLKDMVSDETAKTLAAKIFSSGVHASEMITELIASAREAAFTRSATPVDLGAVLTRVRTNLQVQVHDAGAKLVVRQLPSVDGNEALLRQLFFNLVGNAIKYRSPDRPLQIEVRADLSDGPVTVRVIDNGRGIPVDQREAVFIGGVRVHPEAGVQGDGLGLSTCREIMEQHGGTIRVEDGVDGGSAFVLTFNGG